MTSTTQDRDADLVDQITAAIIDEIGIVKIKPLDERVQLYIQLARDIIEIVREYDMDASAPWPLPQEMS